MPDYSGPENSTTFGFSVMACNTLDHRALFGYD
jgi:hypothetical protein